MFIYCLLFPITLNMKTTHSYTNSSDLINVIIFNLITCQHFLKQNHKYFDLLLHRHHCYHLNHTVQKSWIDWIVTYFLHLTCFASLLLQAPISHSYPRFYIRVSLSFFSLFHCCQLHKNTFYTLTFLIDRFIKTLLRIGSQTLEKI